MIRLFVIPSVAGFGFQLAVVVVVVDDLFVVVAERESEINAEGILRVLIDEFPIYRYGVSPVLWVTRAEASLTGDRLLRMLDIGTTIEWGAPLPWETRSQELRHMIEECEMVLAEAR